MMTFEGVRVNHAKTLTITALLLVEAGVISCLTLDLAVRLILTGSE